MHFILALVLITADGPRPPSNHEMPSLDACLKKATEMMAQVDPDKMREAGYVGYGAGCIVTMDPTSEAGKS